MSYKKVWGYAPLWMPCDTLLANDAYMLMACLAWNLKAWAAQLWPDKEAGEELRRMEFRRFVACVIDIPCQVVETARGLAHRFLACPLWLGQLMDAHNAWKRLSFS